MKALRVILIALLVAGLALGSAGGVLAQGKPDATPVGSGHQYQGKGHGFFGNVTSANETNVELVTNQGWMVNLTLVETTRYMVPAVSRERVRFGTFVEYLGGDIAALEGKRVAVSAFNVVEEPEGVFAGDARHLIVIPDPQVRIRLHAHHAGMVIGFVAGESITIVDRQGTTQTFVLDEATVYHPGVTSALDVEEGSFVTVVALEGTTDPAAAKAIVLHHAGPESWPTPIP